MAAPRLARMVRQLPLGPEGTLRLAVVADTHSQPHPRAAEYLAARAPDAILHAGDMEDLAVLDWLSSIAPVLAIRGNIDVHAPDLPDVLTLDLVRSVENPQPLLRMLLVHIGVHGPKLRAEVAAMARAQGAQAVVCGHSHVPFLGRDRELGLQPRINWPAALSPTHRLRHNRRDSRRIAVRACGLRDRNPMDPAIGFRLAHWHRQNGNDNGALIGSVSLAG